VSPRPDVHLPAHYGDWSVIETQDGLGVVKRRIHAGNEEVVLDCVVAQTAANALDLIAQAFTKGAAHGYAQGDEHRRNRIAAALAGDDD
jgi:hypothetical protein